jgi:hypothetical protein
MCADSLHNVFRTGPHQARYHSAPSAGGPKRFTRTQKDPGSATIQQTAFHAARRKRICTSCREDGESIGMRRRDTRQMVKSSKSAQNAAETGPWTRREDDHVGSGLMK